MSDTTKPRSDRRIRRHPIITKFHVDGREFDSKSDAVLWAEMLYRSEKRIAREKPELTDKRAASAALETAEALFEYAKETDVAPENSAPTDDDSSSVYVQDAGESGGYTNGSDAHVN